MNEIEWKDIIWYEWRYQVNNTWKVRSLYINNNWNIIYRDLILKPMILKHRYHVVCLLKQKYLVHRLVAQAFLWLNIKNPKEIVCHKDDNPWNNNVDNLFIWTQLDNVRDMHNKWRNKKLKITNKNVYQYDKNWSLIKKWNSVIEATIILWISKWSISKCCNNHPKYHHAWWYIWSYNLI